MNREFRGQFRVARKIHRVLNTVVEQDSVADIQETGVRVKNVSGWEKGKNDQFSTVTTDDDGLRLWRAQLPVGRSTINHYSMPPKRTRDQRKDLLDGSSFALSLEADNYFLNADARLVNNVAAVGLAPEVVAQRIKRHLEELEV